MSSANNNKRKKEAIASFSWAVLKKDDHCVSVRRERQGERRGKSGSTILGQEKSRGFITI